MGWEDSFRNAAGYGLFLLVAFLVKAFRDARKPKPCRHGTIGHCQACQKAAEAAKATAERNARRAHFDVEWEKLRRAEIKRLSQIRLRSSEAYFAMGPREFEDAVMRAFRKLGYRVAQTAYVGDGGKDAIAWKNQKKYVIECKRYGNRSATGRRDLQILLAAKHDVEADGAIFVTTGRLTGPAIAYAKENDIQYYDKDSFPDLVNMAYGGAEDFSTAKTICLECGRNAEVRVTSEGESFGICLAGTVEEMNRAEPDPEGATHLVRSTISLSRLKYPELDLHAPWCNDHQVPMRRVSGFRGEFWGCPEYPKCRMTGGSAARSPETARLPGAVDSEREARHAELMQVYNGMSETLRNRWREKIDPEMMQHLLRTNRSEDDIAAYVAARYMQGR
jgi:HJR/Mrr/RecB family endonuclease